MKNPAKKIIVTSDGFNMRRVKFIFEKVFQKEKTKLLFCKTPSEYSGLSEKGWYERIRL